MKIIKNIKYDLAIEKLFFRNLNINSVSLYD